MFGIVHTDTMSPFTAVAARPAVGALKKPPFDAVPVEPLVDANWNGWQIDAILFEDIDGSGRLAPIVIAEYMTGIGPDGAKPFVVVAVYSWNGTKFVHASGVEKKLEGAKDAEEIRRRLAALKKAN